MKNSASFASLGLKPDMNLKEERLIWAHALKVLVSSPWLYCSGTYETTPW